MIKLGEFEIIERFFKPLTRTQAGALGLSDDAAVFDVPADRSVVVSTDTIVEGIHFLLPETEETGLRGLAEVNVAVEPGALLPERLEERAADVAARGFAVGFSDLAAMGADPFGYTLAVALPLSWSGKRLERWLEGFAAELAERQRETGATLLGGDTVGTRGPLSLTFTVLGTVASGQALRRSHATVGDRIYVSGTIGDGGLGLEAVRGGLAELALEHRRSLAARYRRPQPRLSLGTRLIGLAHAAADVSDGLVADLGHICRASGVVARIEAGRIRLSAAARAAVDADRARFSVVLEGGDDYELVFTASPQADEALRQIALEVNLPLTAIGRIEAAPTSQPLDVRPVKVIADDGREMVVGAGGYRHF